MPTSKSRKKAYKPRLIRIPMMPSLRDEFALNAYAALTTLQQRPSVEAWSVLASIFNVVQIAIKDDAKFSDMARLINSGAGVMNAIYTKIDSGLHLRLDEFGAVRNAVQAVDVVLPSLDLTSIYLAQKALDVAHRMEAV